MGDEETFTAEEKEILGESSEEEETSQEETSEEKGEEAEETEETEEKEEEVSEEEKETEKGPIPYSRFKEIHDKGKTLEQKLDLLRRDPEEYYRQYPDEKSRKDEETTTRRATGPAYSGIWSLVVQGGPYDGEVLGNLYDQGGEAARYAMDLYQGEVDNRRSTIEQQQSATKRLEQDADRDIGRFATSLAKDLYDVDTAIEGENDIDNKLTSEQAAEVNKIKNDTVTWMIEKGYHNLSMTDAYFLKNKDKILAGKLTKGIQGLIKSQSGPLSVASKKDVGTQSTGYESDLNLSRDEFAAKIGNMNDEEWVRYQKNAPKKLKEKFPGLPWD